MKGNDLKFFKYEVKKYNFIKYIENLFQIRNLRQLHKLKPEYSGLDLFTNNNDDQTFFHNKFYNQLNSDWPDFVATYQKFIKEIVCPIFKVKTIVYQSTPTFRVQLPNNIAVGGSTDPQIDDMYGWHKDSDPGYNHPDGEKNFIIPLTYARETASLYVEKYPESNVYESVDMNVGEFFKFNGSKCIHGNKKNITNFSRVSLDFRVILDKDYDNNFIKESKLSSKKFIIGGYYERI
jgi:hypothetical protein